MDVSQNLMSLSVLVDDNLISVLDKNKLILIVYKENAISIHLIKKLVLLGQQAANGLCKIPIPVTSLSNPLVAGVNFYYKTAVANSIQLYNDKSL